MTTKKSSPNLNDILQALGDTQPEKTGKSGVLNIECSELDTKINLWLKGREKKKEGERDMEIAELSILPKAENLRIDQSSRDGSLQSSIRINDKIIVTSVNRYSNIDLNDLPTLKEAYGDKTDEYFKTSVDLSLTAEALEDSSVIIKLIKTFGKDDFNRYFNLKKCLKTNPSFHSDRILNENIKKVTDKLIDEGIIKPTKLSLKPV